MKLALVFPGQGAQSVGMMNAYGDLPIVRNTFDEASEVLGRDLWQLAAKGPPEVLAQTVNTQPLMLTAGTAVYRAWLERGGPEPSLVAGHSLGEYTALVASGVLSFKDAVALVQFRAQAMQDAVPMGEGAMAALLGLDDDAVRAVCGEGAEGEVVETANFNAPGQVVIAGHTSAVKRTVVIAKARGAKHTVVLPVSAPFHCSLMSSAADRLRAKLEHIRFAVPEITILHNANVASHDAPVQIKEALVRQACSPVRWVEVVRAMVQRSITHVFECGPGKVLWPLKKRIDPSLQGAALVDLNSLDQAIALCA